jgi:carboxypeptidase C (cathepsin A)
VDKPPAEKAVDNRPEIKSSITEHTITIAGQSVSYRAEAGKMPLKNDAGKIGLERMLHRLPLERSLVGNEYHRRVPR